MPKKKHDAKATLAPPIIVDITTDAYQADLAKGLQEDETLQPGRHTFRRGGFLRRHGATEDTPLMPTKVRISINIDSDILEYFKARAAQLNAAPYQTQINQVLRSVMEQDPQQTSPSSVSYADLLLADQRFIDAVARRVAERSPAYDRAE